MTDPVAVRAVVTPFVERQRSGFQIPGAAFVLVCNGRVVVCDGFGNADLATGSGVDPEQTIFAVGSLSKVVTAVAVMQLVEAGQLDLAADVNTYLAGGRAAFRVPDDYLLPVTAGRLLSHTAGMEDPHIGIAGRDPARLIPLGDYLTANLPRRVLPPDNIAGYCNDGFTLLGYLVELISGMPFEAYVESRIFKPLGMARTTYRQPLPAAARRATGYDLRDKALVPIGRFYVHDVPAAAMTTTAGDMGRLLIALLDDSQTSAAAPRILSPATVAAMLAVRFRNDPRASGWTYGLHGATDVGERRIEHGGLSIGFTGKVVLLPDRHAAFFAVYNRCTQSVLPELDELFAASVPAPPARAPSLIPPGELRRFIGSYRPSLHARHSIERLATLLQPMRVSADDAGLRLNDGSSSIPLRCTGPGAFVRSDDTPGPAIFFRQDAAGLAHLVYGGDDFERMGWYETREAQVGLVFLFTCFFLTHCVVRPLPARWPGWFSRAASATAVVFLAAAGVYLTRMDQLAFLYGIPLTMTAVLAMPWLVAGLAAAFAVSFLRHPRDRRTLRRRRLHAAALLGAFAAFFAMLVHWRMVLPFAN